jgi:xanthine dehydrogenase YagR molybdenum-binding subunit
MADGGGPLIGKPAVRVDGVAKVTGAAKYASDDALPHPAHAYLVTSTVASGRVASMDLAAAKAVPGVVDILTHDNVGTEAKSPPGPDGKTTTTSLESDKVWHDGQIVAVVVAETFEAAREAAYKVKVQYDSTPPSATFDSPGATQEPKARDEKNKFPKVGDAEAAFATAPLKIDQRYSTPTQHHNPIELFTTTCVWDGPNLTIYEPSQTMWGLKAAVAKQLGIDAANVRTVSTYVGGAFGSKGATTHRTVWIAIAARRLGRPVKLVATRGQGFTIATYRAETRHHIRLGATRDGKLTSLSHEGWEVTSRPSDYAVSGVDATARMYACPNIATAVNIVHADRNTPGFMRAPAETPYMFALECAMDELAHELDMDPVELRRVNDAPVDPVNGKPWTSRSLMASFDAAASAFGWDRRDKRPGAKREGEWRIGYGCATSCYPTNIGPAAARLSLTPGGRAKIELAAHEIGNGAYTLVAIVVADRLGLGLKDVEVRMGDSAFPPVTVAGGSNNAATTSNVANMACEDIRSRIAAAAVADAGGAFHGADPAKLWLADRALVGPGGGHEPLAKAMARVAGGNVEAHVEFSPEDAKPTALADLYQGKSDMVGGTSRKTATAFAFGAHFVEVRVHDLTREVRVKRSVSAFAAGTIVNPLTARSQFMGGAIWGLSAALHEATEIDGRAARYVNDNLADYLVPVNADIESVEVVMLLESDDTVNAMGVKGIGEIGIVGMNAAVANAVFNATGIRVRDLPIRIEKLLA